MIKAIETHWKGYRFRSRLEARWAVFFERMGLAWEYEPEGFDLGENGWYLPDFRVLTPQGKPIWYEVKPEGKFSDRKVDAFERALNCEAAFDARGQAAERVALLCGDPISHLARSITYKNGITAAIVTCPRCGLIDYPGYGCDRNPFSSEIIVGCWPCDFETPGGKDNPAEPGLLGLMTTPYKGSILISSRDATAMARALHNAGIAARSARFEHGEVPA